jgi:hypothetical protein
MKIFTLIAVLLLIAGCALNGGVSPTISAVDIDGTWNVVSTKGFCGVMASAFEFKADGNTLTGAVRGPDRSFDLKGIKIQGDKISFKISYRATESSYKEWFYKGVVRGDEIKLNCRSAAVAVDGQYGLYRDTRGGGVRVFRARSRLTLKRQ